MIKTDAQLERTLTNIERFRVQLQHANTLEDPVERKLSVASYEGMMGCLQEEVERYRNAKRGVIQMPRSIQDLTDLCPYITDFRIALGWTQEMLGARLNMTRQAVNQMEEHEYRSITVEQLQTILNALGLITTTEIRHNTIELVQLANNPALACAS
jgi:hypothetical protein